MRIGAIPWGGEHGYGRGSGVTCGLMHRSYGGYAGDVATVANNGLAHFVVGMNWGEAVQLADTESLTYNVGNWDCNHHSVAIEFTGTNDDPLTDWQIHVGGIIVSEVANAHGVALFYDDSAAANAQPPWSGWYAHRAVAADQPPQHFDYITRPAWDAIYSAATGQVSPAPAPDRPKDGDTVLYESVENGVSKWYEKCGAGWAEVPAADAYVSALAGVPVIRNGSPLGIIAKSVQGAKAQKNLNYWLTKV